MEENKQKKSGIESQIPDELSLKGIREKITHPLNATVWRFVLIVAGGCFLSWLFRILFGFSHPLAVRLVALLSAASWVVAIRMLLLSSKLTKFWIVWLAIGFLPLLLSRSSQSIWVASAFFSFVFLLFRRYKPYHFMSSRRRAALFLIGLLVFSLLTLGFLPGKIEYEVPSEKEGAALANDNSFVPAGYGSLNVRGQNLARYSLASLRFFWLFSLFHLFFGLRLHFMKLKPKMAVSAFLIAVLPLLMVVVMGILTLYSTLGESRAARAGEILRDWARLAAEDEDFIHTISDRSFSFEEEKSQIQMKEERPSWLSEFLPALQKEESLYAEWAASDSAKYFWIGPEIWMLNIRDGGNQRIRIAGCMLDETMMNRLARILHSDVRLSFSNPIVFTAVGDVSIKSVRSDAETKKDIYGKYIPEDSKQADEVQSSASIWQRPLYFGMTHMDVVSYEPGKFEEVKILLLLEASLSNIARELLSERNPLSQAVMIILLTLASLLLILESFALFFGIRITSGITSAVKTLHRGTRRIAEGDFDTRIEIPNEDELGDLAVSFNEMAVAVKKGREEALERARLESELAAARKIQEKLLPHKMPVFSGFEIGGTSIPSQQVGGDYFDFLDIGTGKLGIAIADVSGKGMPAALLMANLQASLHAQVVESDKVSQMVARVNNLLVRSTDSNMFATFFYGVLDRGQSTFTSTNAGHNPPLLLRTDGNIERLEAGGLLLGFLEDQPYDQQTVTISPGNVLVLYTDGITEAVGPSGEKVSENLFGEERLIEIVRAHAEKSVRAIQMAILEAISFHTANVPQSDDITLVVIKRTDNRTG